MWTVVLSAARALLGPLLGVALIAAGLYAGKQWMEIRGLRSDLVAANASAAKWEKKHGDCVTQRKELQAANGELAEKLTAQSLMVETLQKMADKRIEEARRLSAAAAKEAEAQKATITWLQQRAMLSQARPGECPEAEAARIVREGLTR